LVSIAHTFNYKRDFYIPAAQVNASEEARTLQLARHV
jgi:cytochrome o ubiquinol oxidase subunit 1